MNRGTEILNTEGAKDSQKTQKRKDKMNAKLESDNCLGAALIFLISSFGISSASSANPSRPLRSNASSFVALPIAF
jgi:hypothetical protein